METHLQNEELILALAFVSGAAAETFSTLFSCLLQPLQQIVTGLTDKLLGISAVKDFNFSYKAVLSQKQNLHCPISPHIALLRDGLLFQPSIGRN